VSEVWGRGLLCGPAAGAVVAGEPYQLVRHAARDFRPAGLGRLVFDPRTRKASPRVPIHEGWGHVVVSAAWGFTPTYVTILREDTMAGHVRWIERADHVKHRFATASILLAGGLAEKFAGCSPQDVICKGMLADIERAVPHLQAVAEALRVSFNDAVDLVATVTTRTLERNRAAGEALADVLASEPILKGARLTAFLREMNIRPAETIRCRYCRECGNCLLCDPRGPHPWDCRSWESRAWRAEREAGMAEMAAYIAAMKGVA
jgi:hypothetical protein